MKNITETLDGLIRALDIRVTKSAITKEIEDHPYNESLLGLSEVLNKWQITNAAYQLGADELNDDFCPFVAYLNKGIKEFEFAVVKKIDDSSVTLYNDHWNDHVLERNQFNKLYNGAVLLVEPEETAGEINYKANHRLEILGKLRLPFIIAALLLVGSNFFIQHRDFSLQAINLFLLNAAGLFLSALIVYQAIRKDSKLAESLCFKGKQSDCEDILSSDAAKIFPWLSWGETGLFYFSGTSLLYLFYYTDPGIQQSLAILSALCVPYIIYSISYQAFVAKKWCIMCSAVMTTLLLEFAVLYTKIANPVGLLHLSGLYHIALCFVLPVVAWVVVKPWFTSSTELSAAKKTLSKFKNNDALFKKILTEQPSFGLPNPEYSIVLGNPASKNVITIVSNPYCNPCSAAHKTLDKWLSVTDDLQIRVILTKGSDEKVARHLIALNNQGDAKLIKQALNDWYKQSKKDYPAWAKKYPAILDSEDCDTMLQQQSDWCTNANVQFTPFVIVNGYQLPESYLLEDLQYLI